MGYFQVRCDSRVVIYEHKLFIRLATDVLQWSLLKTKFCGHHLSDLANCTFWAVACIIVFLLIPLQAYIGGLHE